MRLGGCLNLIELRRYKTVIIVNPQKFALLIFGGTPPHPALRATFLQRGRLIKRAYSNNYFPAGHAAEVGGI